MLSKTTPTEKMDTLQMIGWHWALMSSMGSSCYDYEPNTQCIDYNFLSNRAFSLEEFALISNTSYANDEIIWNSGFYIRHFCLVNVSQIPLLHLWILENLFCACKVATKILVLFHPRDCSLDVLMKEPVGLSGWKIHFMFSLVSFGQWHHSKECKEPRRLLY